MSGQIDQLSMMLGKLDEAILNLQENNKQNNTELSNFKKEVFIKLEDVSKNIEGIRRSCDTCAPAQKVKDFEKFSNKIMWKVNGLFTIAGAIFLKILIAWAIK